MILKEYQKRTVTTVRGFVAELAKWRAEDEAARKHNPNWGSDWVQRAWDSVAAGRRYNPRRNGLGEHLPAFCLKIPTGGGKTLLATRVIDLVNAHFRQSRRGLVLWIVPTTQIYNQTLKALKDRDHPYRQQLDLSSGQRTRIFEKASAFGPRDVAENLCVLLLMLPSANRKTKDTLRMFRDSGGFDRFFPPDDDPTAHAKMLEEHPNLDTFEETAGFWGRYIKTSLGNTVRLQRPLIILDEGHKAYSANAKKTLEGFNPCMIVELSATPAKGANVLVEILGRELNAEEMIKLDLHILNKAGGDWRGTLLESVEHREALEAEARLHEAESGTYIRPICVIQVERTGKQQRKPGYVHTDDVREYLLQHPGVAPEHIAIKTSSKDELKEVDDVGGLLSRDCPIRFIITKQALQEGWDCPFAYVLCALAASSNLSAMTQLAGRILRQPGAIRTGVKALDECHIITHHAETESVVEAIKRGLERDGLGDLQPHVDLDDDASADGLRKISRRPAFSSTEIYLPKVMVTDGDHVRELDYGTDVLSRIDWRDFDPKGIADLIPENARAADTQLRRVSLRDGDRDPFHDETVAESGEILALDPVHAARMILDIVPNPFVGRSIVGQLLTRLRERGFDDMTLGGIARLIVEELRKGLDGERNARAEALFKRAVAAGDIQFRLRLDGRNWRMPVEIETTEAPDARQLLSGDGGPLQRSLFAPVYESEFNRAEREVAVYLDGEETLTWWHRNVARTQYGIQGWRRGRIYPDFIFAVRADGAGGRIVVLETKGDHLDNPGDTAYKREVLSFLSSSFAWDDYTPAGELELVVNDGVTVQCALILMSEWRTKLPNFLSVEAP